MVLRDCCLKRQKRNHSYIWIYLLYHRTAGNESLNFCFCRPKIPENQRIPERRHVKRTLGSDITASLQTQDILEPVLRSGSHPSEHSTACTEQEGSRPLQQAGLNGPITHPRDSKQQQKICCPGKKPPQILFSLRPFPAKPAAGKTGQCVYHKNSDFSLPVVRLKFQHQKCQKKQRGCCHPIGQQKSSKQAPGHPSSSQKMIQTTSLLYSFICLIRRLMRVTKFALHFITIYCMILCNCYRCIF